ncbi:MULTISPECIES: quinolinate synthase NadA [Hydrocarboniphaga]|jgi:quinolinate synthase|uniref:Quinolinate synthase n=1 Tax=Hydrocarboniphaga effusa AP103 TaxID=1172194 RepID=I8T6D3_9GAMM|nr:MULTISPECIES: quinolinate synthase NadA [Hydrocarboniphaga]EIT69475.1 quinolinate synthetase complex, A subunit [Hydrocarboniphaga effusa AP103]MDZ4080501.1 quinolinate synthase NadA [Hydrocarboniphaga sp.]
MSAALKIDQFSLMDDSECDARIAAAKAILGKRLAILGHHYQRNEVFKHADFTGDSLKLSQLAADSDAEFIVFCGVHFMAEVADILTFGQRNVILPDLAAGCSMADMANLVKVKKCWEEISQLLDPDEHVTPVTYINSAADLKAFCGSHGGIVCTSSNARAVLEWSFARREKILFFPDQHLGRNTGLKMGIPLEQMVTWDFMKPRGGLTDEQIRNARMILWKGFCSVHQMFQPAHIDNFRKNTPNGLVISHPENAYEVCQKSDFVGSTEYILRTVRASEPGTQWLVGTELNLVNRLADEMKPRGVNVQFMSPTVCMCSTMFRTDPQHLAWVLDNIVSGNVVNRIRVREDVADPARKALNLMLEVVD